MGKSRTNTFPQDLSSYCRDVRELSITITYFNSEEKSVCVLRCKLPRALKLPLALKQCEHPESTNTVTLIEKQEIWPDKEQNIAERNRKKRIKTDTMFTQDAMP